MTRADHLTADSLSLSTLPPLARVLAGLALHVAAWETRTRTRARLTRLDAHLLADIGVTPHQAASEGTKPFWRD